MTAIQLSIAVISIIMSMVLMGWRITRASRKDVDEKISKKLSTEIFTAYKEDNKEEHARFDKEIKIIERGQQEFQKDMGQKIDKIYDYIITLSQKS